MNRIYIQDLKEQTGSDVKIAGFVQTIRLQGSIAFLLVRDWTGLVQVVVVKKEAPEAFEEVQKLQLESVVEIAGECKETKQTDAGFEIGAKSVKILSLAEAPLPIPVDVNKGAEDIHQNIRFDWRWLDLRHFEKHKVFKVWNVLESAFREVWKERGFMQINMPSFMSVPSESGADVFEVKYFDRKAYLAQSPQFYKQMAIASGFEKVFATGPVFRAEPSFTTRHMTEFTGWDFEMAYIDSYEDVAKEEELMLVRGFEKLNAELGLKLEVPTIPFPRITLKKAKEKLQAKGVEGDADGDLSTVEEKALGEIIREEHGHDFVFVTDYPAKDRAFYHMRREDDPSIALSFDLIYRGLEVTTGAQREHCVDVLEKQAKEKGLSPDELKDYLNYFRYGCPPHGGAGIGPGRIIMKILNLETVKDATFAPRDVKRLTP